jgi:glutaredoxin 3
VLLKIVWLALLLLLILLLLLQLDQISGSPTCIQIQDALNEATGGRSVPRVFIGGNFIGGGDDTAAKQANGELAQLLQAVGLP